MKNWKRYTITAALPYANGPIHIGHLAGCYLPADIYVRYLRSQKRDTFFVCGSDEHGVPITIKARKEGITPQQVVDKYHNMMNNSFAEFGISFDAYGRTSSKIHHQTASDFFKVMFEKNCFEERETEQYYDENAQQFLADRYITGTCPNCGNEHAYGDQCEKCGTSLSPTDLINPKSVLSGAPPVKKLTKNWFLPLNKLQPKIEKYLEQHSDWKTNVYGQCKSWLQSGDGLQPRSMTRDLDWGIPVPVEGAEGKVLYVWFDAPIGYISNTIEHFGNDSDWQKWWKDADTRLVHFIGKDNIVFHCIIFPAMLMEHGDFITADNVPANEFLNLEGDKLSTSRNWAVWLHEYLEEFPGKQDVLRYTLCANMPETKDNDFTWKDFQTKNNSELVAILGNLVNRVLVLTDKYFEGKVPHAGTCTDLQNFILQQKEKVEKSLEEFRFREALHEVMNIARHGNKLLTEKEPWKLIKTDKDATGIVLYDCLQIIANIALIAEPFLPFTSQKLFTMLNLIDNNLSWKNIGEMEILKSNHQLNKANLLFDKIEDDVIEVQVAKLKRAESNISTALPISTENAVQKIAAAQPEIVFDDFAKIDLRVGTILSAEKIEKADKLLKLTVDLGFETRTIVSGIAQHFKPEDLPGTQVCVVANLAPRKLRGIESKGMILMAEDENGKLIFIVPKEKITNGSEVR
ncbi:MAG: methionine--tRNA ligase [Bacteroidetes bacterium 37-13]|nr:MAG: methionine--tRNA ligase [Bacteroidetes bacterium 37-13]